MWVSWIIISFFYWQKHLVKQSVMFSKYLTLFCEIDTGKNKAYVVKFLYNNTL